ncbi:MAG TPA: SH3 domain-containing protein [Pyrinomonadaceae bacterium]|nr:SH3 domain-containing protein [Pyrinomonadaceae bacterium]
MSNDISRRHFMGLLGVAGIGMLTTGCLGLPVIARVGAASLSRVMWGAALPRVVAAGARTVARRGAFRPRVPLVAKSIIDASQWYVEPEIVPSDLQRLEREHPPLTIVDRDGREFENTPYGIYEDIFAVQDAYNGEPLILFDRPSFRSPELAGLSIGEEVGVLDRSLELKTGWYRIQRSDRQIGWAHGNCLIDLDSTKYYD